MTDEQIKYLKLLLKAFKDAHADPCNGIIQMTDELRNEIVSLLENIIGMPPI